MASDGKTETKDVAEARPTITDGVYALVPQLSLNQRGQQRFIKLFVRLVPGPGRLTEKNWELTDEPGVPILAEYITGALPLPAGVVAASWSETGQVGGKTLRSAPTYVAFGKNIGRSNETNVLTQAISEQVSEWNKNARKRGAVTDATQLGVVQNDRVKPMALHSFPAQPADKPFDISGSGFWAPGELIFISPKADGNRMVARVSVGPVAGASAASGSDVTVDLWGRAGDAPRNPLTKIRAQLAAIGRGVLAAGPSGVGGVALPITFDGEVYAHGVRHQLINGTYMNEGADADFLEYWVFDIIGPGTFTERYRQLTAIMARRPADHSNIKLMPAELVSTVAEIEGKYRGFLAAGYEGAVLRKPDGLYQAGTRKEVRSKDVLKLKPEYDAEYEIVGFKAGVGNDSGALIWELKMPDSARTFSVRPRGTIEERRALFAKMPAEFDAEYRGKMLRVIYGDTTADGVPRFPRADEIRATT